ncbi:MAG TPA: DUF4388 domain-containing protein [Thermoanaerobaculia bacterium]|nr:DUF4388 domain-containing protein [Thermoanaerobaculia bacterium]
MSSSNEHSPSPVPQYQTDLAQTPLPEILFTIHRHRAPGMLECRHGDETKKIFFDNGQVIFASSSNIADSLGDKLLRDGKITREQYDESVRRLKTTGKRQGTILAEMKLLEPKELFVSVREQIQSIVWSIFGWDSGTVAFTPGRDKHLEFVKLQIPIPQAVLQGVRRMPDARALVARLGSRATILQKSNVPVDELHLGGDEQRLLDAVDGKRVLSDLVNTPPLAPGENARILYALFALGVVTVKRPTGQIKVQLKVGTPGE